MTENKICYSCKTEKPIDQFILSYGKPKICKTCKKTQNKKRSSEIIMLSDARRRARKKNLDFNITVKDIKIPETCPVLGIKIKKNQGGKTGTHNSPSLDRFDNSKGYTKENIRVISWKANTLKSFGTVEDLEKVLDYMKGGDPAPPQKETTFLEKLRSFFVTLFKF